MKKITCNSSILLKSVVALFVCVSLFSCASEKEVFKAESSIEINPRLIFLNYTISETSTGKKSIDFIKEIVVAGKKRNISSKYLATGRIGDLKCSQLDNKSEVLQSVFIKNPLDKTVEFLNDSLQFERKNLAIRKAPLSLRLQLHENTERILISEVIDTSQNTKPLLITELK